MSDEEIGSPGLAPHHRALARNAPQSTFSSLRRAWPARPPAKAPATGASRSRASPPTPASISKRAPARFVNWRASIETVSGWTDLKRGLTVSVGVAGGGSKTNVVPAEAWAEVDVRIARNADGPRIARKFAALRPADPRCTLNVTGGINRPPMERTRGTVRLFRKAQALGRRTRLRAR